MEVGCVKGIINGCCDECSVDGVSRSMVPNTLFLWLLLLPLVAAMDDFFDFLFNNVKATVVFADAAALLVDALVAVAS
jgi:hypothetical protein